MSLSNQSNLSLPDQPPVASDWNSANSKTTSNNANAKRKVNQTNDITPWNFKTSTNGRNEKDSLIGLSDDALASGATWGDKERVSKRKK
ncbi:hypothetical protein K504DRAFT_466447 [Pleomassaria siparia CBS 279.74]|uniref:Uncharacterized protein n=1 Tax=Pleomassaria siparia CBS 279.74 TaxID=1314801 RepID=A0A6G1KC34_9PLEO|nr:hypothetical protein K504DRAFT_466447 [Pleomassaria siparia CBS 279.74]